MNKESQRIAIAEACPSIIRFFEGEEAWCYHDGQHWTPCKNNDPLNDLNAMHEAEKVLNEDQARLFNDLLFDSKDVSKLDGSVNDYVWHAAADHRAEVFLRTLGLWKDDASNLSMVATHTASINKKE